MKKFILSIALALFILNWLPISAQNAAFFSTTKNDVSNQERCGTAIIHERLMQIDPEYKKRIMDNEAIIQNIINSRSVRSGTYTIPVVVHVLHLGEAVGTGTNISDAQINSAITNLNNCYGGVAPYSNNIGIQFQLAQRKYDCSSTTGIVRINASGTSDYATNGITTANEATIKALSRWPNSEYYNIWIVSEIDNNGGGAGTQGYAYYPGAGSTVDGAVILYNSFGYDPTGALGYNLKNYTNRNVTTLHELGHAFNLKHTFEGDSNGTICPPNTTCASQGDLCCDTEAHNRNDGDCGATGTTCSGQNIANIVNNIMAYSSDVCQTVFTADQKTRMLATITGSRASLTTSPGLVAISGSAPSVAKSCSPATTSMPNGFGMGVFGLKIGSTEYSSSSSDADGGFRNNWCSNFNLTVNTSYAITVTNGTVNNEKVKVYIDYNNDGDFVDAGEEVFVSNTGAKSHSGNFTTAAAPVTGQALWLRVVSDFSGNTITGPCYTPQYGQVEDFSVLFPASGATQLISAQCGSSVATLAGTFDCNAVTNAQDYEWEFTNSGLGYSFTKIRGNSMNTIPRTWITGLQFGQTYNVRVRAKIGGVWGSYGSTCTMTISGSVPGTQMSSSQCGLSIADLSGLFYNDAIDGAQDYEWEFTNSGLGYSFTKIRGNNMSSIPRTWITGLQFGQTYNVRVRTKIGGVWGSYGTTCTITLSGSTPTTQLSSTYCGLSVADLSGTFTCNAVTGAQDYEWEFTNAGLGYTFNKVRGNYLNDMPRTWITGLQFGQTYNVRIRTKVGGVWGSYGTTCALTISGSVPTTQLSSTYCGLSITDLSGTFTCNAVTGAQDYEWEFTCAAQGYSYTKLRGNYLNDMPRSWIPGLQYGRTYNVRIRTKVAGVWGSYGTVCTLTFSGSIPSTQLTASQCGQSMNLNGAFYNDAVIGAQDYEWEFTNSGLGYSYTKLRGNSLLNMPKSWIPGLQNGVTYDVRVRANVGGAWGSYSTICQVTINTSLGMIVENSNTRSFVTEVATNLSQVNIYPNPSNSNGFNVSYSTIEENTGNIQVIDMLGKVLINRQINNIAGINEIKLNTDGNLLPGCYVIVIKTNTDIIKKNIVVQ